MHALWSCRRKLSIRTTSQSNFCGPWKLTKKWYQKRRESSWRTYTLFTERMATKRRNSPSFSTKKKCWRRSRLTEALKKKKRWLQESSSTCGLSWEGHIGTAAGVCRTRDVRLFETQKQVATRRSSTAWWQFLCDDSMTDDMWHVKKVGRDLVSSLSTIVETSIQHERIRRVNVTYLTLARDVQDTP